MPITCLVAAPIAAVSRCLVYLACSPVYRCRCHLPIREPAAVPAFLPLCHGTQFVERYRSTLRAFAVITIVGAYTLPPTGYTCVAGCFYVLLNLPR